MTIIRLRIAIAHSTPSVGRAAATAVLFNWRRLAQFNRSGAQRRSGNVLAVIVALALMNRPATGPCSGRRADNCITLRAAEPALVHPFSVNTPIWRQKMEIIHTFAMRMLACPTLVCE